MTFKVITIIFIGFAVFVGGHVGDSKGFSLSQTDGSYAVSINESSGFSRIKHSSQEEEDPLEVSRKWLVPLYLFLSLCAFTVIGIVCGDYFLPSIDCICFDLKLSQDVAAATFMSFATTAPELFMIIISTFISESDVGVGAVVGSGMFNTLGVATIGGLAAVSPIKLDWWPLYRDSLVYVVAPILLAVFLSDGEIDLIESIILILYYIFYYIIMYFNKSIRKNVKIGMKAIKKKSQNCKKENTKDEKPALTVLTIQISVDDKQNLPIPTVISPEETNEGEAEIEDKRDSYISYFMSYDNAISLRRGSLASMRSRISNQSPRISTRSARLSNRSARLSNRSARLSNRSAKLSNQSPRLSNSYEDETKLSVQSANFIQVEDEAYLAELVKEAAIAEESNEDLDFEEIPEGEEEQTADFRTNFCTCPDGSKFKKIIWVFLWPINLALFFTVPDCRSDKWRKFYPLTFVMSVVWIGGASFLGTWTISEIGNIFNIPESVMGLTFLAYGGSMPEAFSTFIMARQGEGGLGFSNSLGSGTMEVCLCLGVPWLIKCSLEGKIEITSNGIQFNSMTLFIGVVVLLAVSSFTKFHMNKKMGIICGFWYLVFVVFSLLIELDVISITW